MNAQIYIIFSDVKVEGEKYKLFGFVGRKY